MYKHNYPIALLRHLQRTTLLSALATLLLTGCGMVEGDEGDCTPTNDSRTYVQVRVTLANNAETRSPSGGEDGDGREPGINHENDINDVTLLFYQSAAGINAAVVGEDEPTMEFALYFTSLTQGKDENNNTYYTTAPRELPEGIYPNAQTEYHVIAIANAGDLTQTLGSSKLSEVRDHIVTKAWTATEQIASYHSFVMSSEDDAVLKFDGQTGDGTRANPYLVTAYIERIAARIDFQPNDLTPQDVNRQRGLVYDVYRKEDGKTPTGKYVLTHVVPFNELTQGSYLIKRVLDSENNMTYLGNEEKDADDVQTNWVVDPYWTEKTSTAGISSYYTRPFATAEGAAAIDPSEFTERWAVKKADETGSKGEDEKYYILDYTLENTTSNNDLTYATGLIFTGTYYSKDQWGETGPAAGTEGETRTYVYYLRHSDPKGEYDATKPMLYGTVRNNIYRVEISKILDTPEPTGMQITINVRQWALYEHSPIVM